MEALLQLKEYLAKRAFGGLCVAFSGGADSAALLKAACEVCGNVHAVTAATLLHPQGDVPAAEIAAADAGAKFKLLALDLPDAVLDNPRDRCYLCKKAIFSAIREYAAQNGLETVLDGTNADDLGEYRPGLRALRELGIKSPLAELGFSKPQVREIGRQLGLAAADKPSAPCLATRIPYGVRIEEQALRGVDALESFIRALGPRVVRARIHGDTARIEVLPQDFGTILIQREAIAEKAKEYGLSRVTLDLEGFRSGSFDSEKNSPA